VAASNGFIKHKGNAPQEWEAVRVGSETTSEHDWDYQSGAPIVLSAREGPLIRVPPGGATDGRWGACVPVSERSTEYVWGTSRDNRTVAGEALNCCWLIEGNSMFLLYICFPIN